VKDGSVLKRRHGRAGRRYSEARLFCGRSEEERQVVVVDSCRPTRMLLIVSEPKPMAMSSH
jgi:hypothetical protein